MSIWGPYPESGEQEWPTIGSGSAEISSAAEKLRTAVTVPEVIEWGKIDKNLAAVNPQPQPVRRRLAGGLLVRTDVLDFSKPLPSIFEDPAPAAAGNPDVSRRS